MTEKLKKAYETMENLKKDPLYKDLIEANGFESIFPEVYFELEQAFLREFIEQSGIYE